MRVTLKTVMAGSILGVVMLACAAPARAQQPVVPGSTVVALPPVPMAQFGGQPVQPQRAVPCGGFLPTSRRPTQFWPPQTNRPQPQSPQPIRANHATTPQPPQVTPEQTRVMGITIAILGLVLMAHKSR